MSIRASVILISILLLVIVFETSRRAPGLRAAAGDEFPLSSVTPSPLDRRIEHVEIRSATFAQAARSLCSAVDADLVLQLDDLNPVVVNARAHLRLDLALHDVTLGAALKASVDAFEIGDAHVFADDAGRIVITDKESTSRRSVIWDARDLIPSNQREAGMSLVQQGGRPPFPEWDAGPSPLYDLGEILDYFVGWVHPFAGRFLAEDSVRTASLMREILFGLAYPRDRFRMGEHRSLPSSSLDRRITNLHLDHVTPERAISLVCSAAGANVMIHPTIARPDAEISAHLEDMTVEQALLTLSTDPRIGPNSFEFNEESGIIVVGPDNLNLSTARVYDVRRILRIAGPWYQPSDPVPLEQNSPDPLIARGNELASFVTSTGTVSAKYWRGRLIVVCSPREHGNVARALFNLQNSTPQQ